MMGFKAALDFSGNEIAFAVVSGDGRKSYSSFTELPDRNSSKLPCILREQLAKAEVQLEEIQDWTIGIGPGSFTALRIGAAFLLGLLSRHIEPGLAQKLSNVCSPMATCEPFVSLRGVPSACGIPTQGNNVLVLYDGRKSELLSFGLRKEGDAYVPDGYQGVLSTREQLGKLQEKYDVFVTRSLDLEAVRAFSPEIAVEVSPHVDPEKLCLFPHGEWDCNPTEPLYLRPPVFVPPSAIRHFAE